ncbi:response regulator [Adlercreutzia agrestimuris]|uniref:response regulator n=1 Tax=Adlercreutzia agrestimuris TaxID=2941324 RepID=UPI00203E84C5|nr:response regulator [Adlercreutzia agrestimuris]
MPETNSTEDIKKQYRATSRLAAIIAGVVVVLLITSYIVITNNVVSLTNQIDSIRTGAYPVSVAAGRVETLLVQLQTLADIPLYVRTDEAINGMERSYEQIDDELCGFITVLAESEMVTGTEGIKLQEGYEKLVSLQEQLLVLAKDGSVTDVEIAAFVNEDIRPLIAELLQCDITILEESSDSVEALYASGAARGTFTIMLATVLFGVVLISLIAYLLMLRRRIQQQEVMQQKVEDALALAESASAAKSQFLSNMSHDIRTPMNAIVGLTTIATSHIDDTQRVQECLNRISTSSKHLLCLINDVLDMSKIERGKIMLNEERFNFPDMINEVVTIVQPQTRAKKLMLDIVIGNIEQEVVIGDSMRINQALLNLLGNAVKYTPEGGMVRFSLSEETSRRVGYRDYRFVVQDNGVGMTEDFVKHVFDPFEREEGGFDHSIEGTGLGMAITKNVVEMMGGTIEVKSTKGKGSTFTMTIPLKPAEDSDVEEDFSQLEGLEVLIVDDDTDVLENTVAILKEVGVVGSSASSGLEAVALVVQAHVAKNDYQAIIVDWMMPGVDGIETIRRIREEVGDAMPIILLTAYDWTEVEDEARDAGVTAFISKPLFKSRLCHVLKACCVEQDIQVSPRKAQEEKKLTGRVLLVEDNELNREIARELIGQTGAVVEEACDGVKAVSMVSKAPDGYYDLVFMDMKMPRMDGIEATRTICEIAVQDKRRMPPIVAMTANAFSEDRIRALDAGMEGFMTKPIDVKELNRTLRMYLS